jgi:hypothetical protein
MPDSPINLNNQRMKQDNQQEEQNKKQSAAGEETPIYLSGDSTLQTPDEDRHDSSIDPREDRTRSVSNDDLRETGAGSMAGSDRAGTSERKDNSV